MGTYHILAKEHNSSIKNVIICTDSACKNWIPVPSVA